MGDHPGIFNVAGEKIATLVDGWRGAGQHSARLERAELTSGIYFYRLESGDFGATSKMTLIK